MKGVRHSVLTVAAALATTGGASAGVMPANDSGPSGQLVTAIYNPATPVTLERTQWVAAGNYCWYPGGWHGPGYYWCGYAWRTGFGWGGPWGWRGWRWRSGYWGGGRYWTGAWRGGGNGWHGDHGWHGGHGGGWHGGWHGGHGGHGAHRR